MGRRETGSGTATRIARSITLLTLLAASASAFATPPGSGDDCNVEGMSKNLRGLCHAYCETLDCDGDTPNASATACERVLQNYVKKSPGGAPPPCVLPAGYQCYPDGFALPATIDVERDTGEIETLDFEEYLKGVLPREIGTSAEMATLEAQAIASRTYALRYILDNGEPICDGTSCQAYGDLRYERTDQAVENTRGVVALHDDQVIWAAFHASSGGRTRDAAEIWQPTDYLVAVSGLENATCADDCEAWYPVDQPPCDKDQQAGCCYGRVGHAVGMSQRGAMAMAMCGYDHVEILTHYYQGISLAMPCGD